MINSNFNGVISLPSNSNGINGGKTGQSNNQNNGSNGHSNTNGHSKKKNWVNLDNINPCIKMLKHAVQGAPLVVRGQAIEKELQQGVKKPFKEIIWVNLGDGQALGQKPNRFMRQVLGLCTYKDLFDDPNINEDAKSRAREILLSCDGGSIGSYSHSSGIKLIREHAAEYIEARDDGIPSNWEDIFLASGTSDIIKSLMSLMNCPIDGKRPGCMIPIPQYPLYSEILTEFDMVQVGYYLDESNNWALDISELQRSIDQCRKVCAPRAIVVINPGNPTGQVLSKENIQDIIKFAYEEKLFIFADEVYQDNIYADGSEFHSFKKVMAEMGKPYIKMEMASFMSCSKGFIGECGLRAGLTEVINMCPDVKEMFYKSISAQCCPTILGQIAIDVLVNPPKPGEPSYAHFTKEKNFVLAQLKIRAKMVAETFNSLEGFSCNPVQGAMYAFPQIKLPPRALEAAKKAGQTPDQFYAFQLLEYAGICIAPGTAFGQRPGTSHFRTTILPQTEKLKEMLELFKSFQADFLKKYK